jgi:NAD(P)-dependent dehydrogenase (short-subunit alcohol dehydrogenase family)
LKLESGQVAVVTGGGSGIGLSLAKAFGDRGLRVVLADIDRQYLDEAVDGLRARAVDAVGATTDVADIGQVRALRTLVMERFGRVDVVCNNAGVTPGGRRATWEFDRLDWAWVMNVNLWGLINGLNVFVPTLVAQQSGYVVNTASMAGVATVPYIAPYTATKHAIVGISEALRDELAERAPRVGVSVVCPGGVRTRLAESGPRNRPAALTPDYGKAVAGAQRRALSGVLEPAAVADATLAAIEADRLHVFPSSDTLDWIQARVSRLMADARI